MIAFTPISLKNAERGIVDAEGQYSTLTAQFRLLRRSWYWVMQQDMGHLKIDRDHLSMWSLL